MSTAGHPGPGASGVPWLVMSPTRAAGCAMRPSVDADERAAKREGSAGFDVQRAARLDRDFGRLDSQFGCRLNRDGPAVALDHDAIALAVIDADAVVVDRELLAVVQFELYEPLAAVVERQLVPLARLDLTDVVLAIGIRLRRPVVAVPERSDDVGESEVAALERDEHFVLDFGNEVDAAVLAGHGSRDARPVALIRLAVPGIGNLDAAEPA